MERGTHPTTLQEQIEESLSRFGRYVTSTDADALALSLASSALPEIVWAFIWHQRHGDLYELNYQLPSNSPPPLAKLEEILTKGSKGAVAQRKANTLRFNKLLPIEIRIDPPLPSGRPSRVSHRVALVPYGAGKRILEAYVNPSDELGEDGPLDLSALAEVLDMFQRARELEASSNELLTGTDGSMVPEAQLFAVIHHDIKAWLGKSLGASHLFLYDARDRMLYHRATDSLSLFRPMLQAYEPVPQARNKDLLDFVRVNIDHLEGASDAFKEGLHTVLQNLGDALWIRKNAAAQIDELRSLLSLLPQEPGTGIAGNTALTRIPEISNRTDEELWNPGTYSQEVWFPLMLSVEKLFGIASHGSMAAVPLLESGQLAGVLFVMRDRPFDRGMDTLMLLERAAQASPLLTLYRTQRFHQALVRDAIANPSKSIAEIVAGEAHHAFNAALVAHWGFVERRIGSVSLWGYSAQHARYGLLRVYDTRRGMFRDEKITSKIQEWARERSLQVLRRPNSDDEHHRWGLPKEIVQEREQSSNVRLASGLVIAPPLTRDILVVYSDEPAAVLDANRPQILQKLQAMQAVEQLRFNPKQPAPPPVGETDEFKRVLRLAESAAQHSRVLIWGPSGSGKTLLAEYIYKQSARKGRLERLGVKQTNSDLFNQEAYGRVEGALGIKSHAITGKFDNEGGTVIIDDIDVANDDVKGALLGFLDKGIFTPVGGQEVVRNVQVIATTNRSKENLQEGPRRDMLRRFRKSITVPPLSVRRLDIPLLVRHFLRELGAPDVHIFPDAMHELMNRDFEYDVDSIQRMLEDFVDEGIKVLTKESLPEGSTGQERLVILQDGTPYFKRWTGTDDPVHLFLTGDVYPPNPRPDEDWVQFPIRGFRVLANRRRHEGKPPEISTYVSIGCGAGLDAIAAARELKPRSMVLTDLRWDVVSVARENVLHNSTLRVEAVDRRCGSLFETVPADLAADVIFENLPVIPGGEGANKGRLTGTYFCEGRERHVPDIYRHWTLDSHYLFLSEAKHFLDPAGCVVCSIGGRMPWHIVEQMFVELGYTPELLVYDLKEQEEFAEVAGGLAKLERKHGVEFRFVDLDEARRTLQSIPTRTSDDEDGVRGFATAREETDRRLDEIAMSAEKALSHKGRVGHTVYMVCGTLRADG